MSFKEALEAQLFVIWDMSFIRRTILVAVVTFVVAGGLAMGLLTVPFCHNVRIEDNNV